MFNTKLVLKLLMKVCGDRERVARLSDESFMLLLNVQMRTAY